MQPHSDVAASPLLDSDSGDRHDCGELIRLLAAFGVTPTTLNLAGGREHGVHYPESERSATPTLDDAGWWVSIERRRLELQITHGGILAAWLAPGGDRSDLPDGILAMTPPNDLAELIVRFLDGEDQLGDLLDELLSYINAAFQAAVRRELVEVDRRASIAEMPKPRSPVPDFRPPLSRSDLTRRLPALKEILRRQRAQRGDPPLTPFVFAGWQFFDVLIKVIEDVHVHPSHYQAHRGPDQAIPVPRRGNAPRVSGRVFDTRIARLVDDNSKYRVTCGAPKCPKRIGVLYRTDPKDIRADMRTGSLLTWALLTRDANDGEPPVGEWILWLEKQTQLERGFWWDGDVYRVIQPGAVITDPLADGGVLPKLLQNADAIANDGRGIVGRFPSPPCLMICSRCKSINRVAVP